MWLSPEISCRDMVNASRSVSPNRLKPNTARLMASPGKIASQGACSMNARPVLLSISPQDGVGGWVPTPR